MQYISPANRANLMCVHGDNINGLPIGAKDLKFVSRMVAMDHDNDSQITGKQTIFKEILGQYNLVVLFNHRFPPMDTQ